jgi:hypothetical protein
MSATAPAARTSTTVQGTMNFLVDTGEKPVTYPDQQLPSGARMTGTYEDRLVTINDGRAIRDRLSLDKEGFLLLDNPSRVKNFYDEDELKTVGYPEVDALLRQLTGAKKVVIFDHTIRVEDLGKRKELNVRAPVPSVHNDYTDWSAPKRVRDLLTADEAEERLKGRYMFLNVWRPLHGPVESYPLVLCDALSMGPRDFVAADHIYDNGRRGETYRMAFNPSQQWYYFSRMQTDEVVIIKCFDSMTDGRARYSGHGAARLTTPPPAGAKPRESIEIRTVVFL